MPSGGPLGHAEGTRILSFENRGLCGCFRNIPKLCCPLTAPRHSWLLSWTVATPTAAFDCSALWTMGAGGRVAASLVMGKQSYGTGQNHALFSDHERSEGE